MRSTNSEPKLQQLIFYSAQPRNHFTFYGARMTNQKYFLCIIVVLVCSWCQTHPLRAGQSQIHEDNKPLDTKQIERLERQLSDIRKHIDTLRQINDTHTQNVTGHLARRAPGSFITILFTGLWFTKRGQKDDFRVSDRVITVRRINGSKQITGYGVVAYLDDDTMEFEVLRGSSTMLEDEVYVVNREDTSASSSSR